MKNPVICQCGGSLQNISPRHGEWLNLYCSKCQGHWSGNIGEEKWISKKEWDKFINGHSE